MITEIQPLLLESEERTLSAMAEEAGLDAQTLSALQAKAREEALEVVSLDMLNDSLADVASLLDVAFNALDKTGVQSRISSIRDDLDTACRSSFLLARQMENKLTGIIGILIKCYGMALDGRLAEAVKALLEIAAPAEAAEMLAEKLRVLFEVLADAAEDVYNDAIVGKNVAYQQAQRIGKEISAQKAEISRAEAEAAALTETINSYTQIYLDELASEQQERERQDTQQIVNGFLTVVSCLLMCTGTGFLLSLGRFAALAATGGDRESVRRHQEMAADILKKKTELERQRVKQLEQARLFSENVAGLQSEQEAWLLERQNLYYASCCFKRVALEFNQLYHFWGQLKSYCATLRSRASRMDLEDVIPSNAPIQRVQRQEIAQIMLPCAAQWHTMRQILRDYQRISEETLDRLGKDMREIPTGETAFSFAKEKAARFREILDKEIAKHNRIISKNEASLQGDVQ